MVLGHPRVILAALVLAAVLAALAAYNDGSILLTWDEPIQRWVESNRSAGLETLFRGASRLGSNVVIFSVAAVLAGLTWRRCRFLALAILIAALSRPAIEYVVKALIDRPRPDLDPLLPGTGPSHPSGHVLASAALWGLVPAAIALYTGRAWIWRTAEVVVMAMIVLVAASRVYLGVHWLSDVVAGIVLGALYLLVIERAFLRMHPEGCCAHDQIQARSTVV